MDSVMNNKSFSNTPQHLSELVEEALKQAKANGATAAEADVSKGSGDNRVQSG